MSQTVREQLRNNLVALISLVVALSSLSYNTWRNQQTEENRNVRVAAFEVLKQLGELQLVVNSAFFAKDTQLGHPMVGWGRVAMISDLSQLLPAPAPRNAQLLHDAWQNNWQQLAEDEQAANRVSEQIDQTRDVVRGVLRNLR